MKKEVNKVKKKHVSAFVKYIIIFLVLIMIYVLSLILSVTYPKAVDDIVNHRITVSANRLYESEKEYEPFFTDYKNGRLGNYADSIMMHIIYNSRVKTKLEWAIGAPIYGDTYAPSQLQALYNTVNGNQTGEIVYYSRYWHGYRVWLKLLFVFFEYQQIRLFNAFIFYIMLFACLAYLYKKINWQASLSLLVSVIFVNITLIPMCINYINVYILSFIAIMVAVKSYISSTKNLGLLFFIIGSITMFFDFYTYPYLTLGYPLAAIVFYTIIKKEKTTFELFKISLMCIFTWTLGYLLTWGANILLSGLIFGAEELQITRSVVDRRLSNNGESINTYVPVISFFVHAYKSIVSMIKEMLQPPNGYIYTLFLICWVGVFSFYKKKHFFDNRYLSLLALVAYIFIWFGIAPSPALYFQYKGVALYIFLLTYLLLNSIDYIKISKKMCRKRVNDNKPN